jgi:hypothetical protein
MHEEPTPVVIQRYLDALPRDAAAEPLVRELPERAVRRLRLFCASVVYKTYLTCREPWPSRLAATCVCRSLQSANRAFRSSS